MRRAASIITEQETTLDGCPIRRYVQIDPVNASAREVDLADAYALCHEGARFVFFRELSPQLRALIAALG